MELSDNILTVPQNSRRAETYIWSNGVMIISRGKSKENSSQTTLQGHSGYYNNQFKHSIKYVRLFVECFQPWGRLNF
jgi:hypothetical protein